MAGPGEVWRGWVRRGKARQGRVNDDRLEAQVSHELHWADSDAEVLHVYVLPSVEGMPPRAVIWPESIQEDPEVIPGGALVVVWMRDQGAWAYKGLPVPEGLGEAITEHAKSLGVRW